MSYCRFSTDDRQCDLYVFDHCDGYLQIYVAGRRAIPLQPLPPVLPWPPPETPQQEVEVFIKEWLERDQYVSNVCYADDHKWEDVPEKYAGKTYQFDDYESAAQLIEQMIADGIRCPAELPQWLREDGE